MKKLITFMVMFAISVGSGIASADRVYVPWIIGYGNSDYTTMYVTNLSSATTAVTVSFSNDTNDLLKSSLYSTNTLTVTTVATANVAAGFTWEILTNESLLFSSTTSQKRATVVITSSASNEPNLGSLGVHALFVHVSTDADPSGFLLPSVYRVSSFAWSSNAVSVAGLDGSTTVNDWRQ